MKLCCHDPSRIEAIKGYDPQPKNRDGSIRWFLFRWDDGKNGSRRLVRCRCCGSYYLIQSYHLNRFSQYQNTVFEDWYAVESERQADHWNQIYTGIQLERKVRPELTLHHEEENRT